MTKLNQLLAVEKDVKNKVFGARDRLYKLLQKSELFVGLSRRYEPKDEEGEQLPSENKIVQLRTNDILEDAKLFYGKLFDVTAEKDWTNTVAKANVVVNDEVLLENVPPPYLLFLEKNLTDLRTFLSKLPVLDPAEEWEFDANQNLYKTGEVKTNRSKKVVRYNKVFEPTDHQPGQYDKDFEDVQVGTWINIKYSGAIDRKRLDQLLNRVDVLLKAVKYAREDANKETVVDGQTVGKKIFDFVLAE